MNKFGLDNETIDLILGVLTKYLNINEVKIYGSRAKGNFRNGSDIDLSIELDDNKLLGEILYELENLPLPYMFDLTNYNTIKNQNLKEHIDRVGKQLKII